jgi:predicted PurR-regulated permease PerM
VRKSVPGLEGKRVAAWVALAVVSTSFVAAWLLFRPFFSILLTATVFAILTYPTYRRLAGKVGETLAAVAVSLAVTLVLAIPLALAGAAVVQQVQQATGRAEGRPPAEVLLRDAESALVPALTRLGVERERAVDHFEENRERHLEEIYRFAGLLSRSVGLAVIGIFLALLTLVFMLRDGHRLREPTLRLVPLPRDKTADLLDRLAETVRAVFVGFVLLAFLQTAVAGALYYLLGAPNYLLWTFVTLVLCMIPVLNAPIVFVPMGIYFLAQGAWHKTLILYLVGFGVISVIDNVLRPVVIGRRISLHPIAIFFSLIGGIWAYGPIGIMAGPMLLMLLLGLLEVVRERLAESAG